MNTYRADLHIHSVLSSCGDLEMSPGNIVAEAARKGIDIIAVTDHNHTGHSRLTRELGARKGIWVVYGAELTTQEEVHCLTFFDTDEQLDAFQTTLDENMPLIPSDPALFGYQMIVDEKEQILEEVKHSLYPGVEWGIGEAAGIVHELGGLFIPAHVDRTMNGLYAQLGVWPGQLEVDGIEISRHTTREKAIQDHPELAQSCLISNSDAHYLDDIGGIYNSFVMKHRDFNELRLALRGEKGRGVK
ncbi:MAG: PHP domain-containing protein [Bacteroidetes bacterium]|nr:PHP domain-containing protein [Bacteroidota bacterium]